MAISDVNIDKKRQLDGNRQIEIDMEEKEQDQKEYDDETKDEKKKITSNIMLSIRKKQTKRKIQTNDMEERN